MGHSLAKKPITSMGLDRLPKGAWGFVHVNASLLVSYYQTSLQLPFVIYQQQLGAFCDLFVPCF